MSRMCTQTVGARTDVPNHQSPPNEQLRSFIKETCQYPTDGGQRKSLGGVTAGRNAPDLQWKGRLMTNCNRSMLRPTMMTSDDDTSDDGTPLIEPF